MSRLDTTEKNSKYSFEEIMIFCERYRDELIRYVRQYYKCEYEYAEDCVQEAYTALLEHLSKGAEVKNYQAWLFASALNCKSKCNASDSADSEDRNEMIAEQALNIISQLNCEERELYISYYWKHKKLKDIADEMNITHDAVRKRHEKLKKKLNEKIKECKE